MESWRLVFRDGFVLSLSTTALTALADALRSDDKRLIQGSTTTPPPLMCVADWPVEAACALGLCGWVGEDLTTVGEVEEFFAKACFDADQRLGEPAACRWFLNWFDDTPRDEMRRELLAEVEHAINSREALDPALASALAAAPDDRTLRCACADWYREHGDEASAMSMEKGNL